MSRKPRIDIAYNYYHCMNRANARLKINFSEKDYLMFLELLKEAVEIFHVNLISFVLMPNHFHLLIHTEKDAEMGKFMRWLTLTYTHRWHRRYNTVGYGHLFQGRYKSVLIKNQKHLENTIRYIERNPLNSDLVKNIFDWRYSSLFQIYKNEIDKYAIQISKKFIRDDNYIEDLIKNLSLKEMEVIF